LVYRGVGCDLAKVQLVIVKRAEVTLDIVDPLIIAHPLGGLLAIAIAFARVSQVLGGDAADAVSSLVHMAMAGRARSEGQANAHVKANLSHRGCSFEEVVEFVNAPKLSEEVGFLNVARGLCSANAFQDKHLRVGVRFDMSTILRASTLIPSGLEC